MTVDGEHGGWLAARQLVRQVCRRIAYVTGPRSILAVRERIAGARLALAEHGLELPDEQIVHGQFSEEHGYTTMPRLLHTLPQLEGCSAAATGSAGERPTRSRSWGVSVPDQVALVGFGNWALLATSTRPALTSVDMDLYQLGLTVSQMLLDAIAGTMEAGVRTLPRSPAVRPSCPAPADDDRSGPAARLSCRKYCSTSRRYRRPRRTATWC